jgi:hypothetical protein
MRARSLIAEHRHDQFEDETTSARVRNTLADALAELDAVELQGEEVDLDALPVPVVESPTVPLRPRPRPRSSM